MVNVFKDINISIAYKTTNIIQEHPQVNQYSDNNHDNSGVACNMQVKQDIHSKHDLTNTSVQYNGIKTSPLMHNTRRKQLEWVHI